MGSSSRGTTRSERLRTSLPRAAGYSLCFLYGSRDPEKLRQVDQPQRPKNPRELKGSKQPEVRNHDQNIEPPLFEERSSIVGLSEQHQEIENENWEQDKRDRSALLCQKFVGCRDFDREGSQPYDGDDIDQKGPEFFSHRFGSRKSPSVRHLVAGYGESSNGWRRCQAHPAEDRTTRIAAILTCLMPTPYPSHFAEGLK